jgi:hypothetical protein
VYVIDHPVSPAAWPGAKGGGTPFEETGSGEKLPLLSNGTDWDDDVSLATDCMKDWRPEFAPSPTEKTAG